MKKSSTLMLSYIIFLVITVIIKFCFGWTGLGQVALAATIAGFFFAFADLLNWYISYKKPLVDAIKSEAAILKQFTHEAKEHIRKDADDIKQAVEIVKAYANKNNRIQEFIDRCEETNHGCYQFIDAIEGCKLEMNKIEKGLDKITNKLSRIGTLEVVLAILGFVAFFLLLCLKPIVEFVMPFGETITVLAFVTIMFNYFLRDVLEDKGKKELTDMNNQITHDRAYVEDVIKNMRKTNCLETAQKLAEEMEKHSNMGVYING